MEFRLLSALANRLTCRNMYICSCGVVSYFYREFSV